MPQVIEPDAPPDILVRAQQPVPRGDDDPAAAQLVHRGIDWPGSPDARDASSGMSPSAIGSLAQYFGSHPAAGFPRPGRRRWPRRPRGRPRLALAIGQNEHELKAVSLRDGRLLWSQPFTTAFADLAHDPRSSSPARAHAAARGRHGRDWPISDRFMLVVRAFDGRDGKRRWTWDGGAEYPRNRPSPLNAKMRHEGGKADRLCVNFQEFGGKRRIVVLGADGREVVRRDLPGEYLGAARMPPSTSTATAATSCSSGTPIGSAPGTSDLKELWSWPDPSAMIDRILPASAGRPSVVILSSGLSLDGRTGQPRWRGQAGLAWSARSPDILDPGDSTRLPLLVSFPTGATICRMAMPRRPRRLLRTAPRHPGAARTSPRRPALDPPAPLDRADRPPAGTQGVRGPRRTGAGQRDGAPGHPPPGLVAAGLERAAS